jgi:hypothetical protein
VSTVGRRTQPMALWREASSQRRASKELGKDFGRTGKVFEQEGTTTPTRSLGPAEMSPLLAGLVAEFR